MIDRFINTPWGKWVLFIGGWALLSLLFAPEVYLYNLMYLGRPIPWLNILQLTLVNAAVVVLFLPLIVFLTRRFPVERGSWHKALLVHVPACFAFGAAHSALYWAVCYASHALGYMLFFRFQPNLLTYWAIVGFTQAVDYFQRYTERERQLAKAQLLLLKSQLQPHFLFNTLNTISAMMHEDVDAAEKTVMQLSDLLRLTLDNIGMHEIPLHKELDFVRKYSQIEQTRYPDTLQVRLDVEPATLDALVPSMILQPLVENSIRHGLDLRKDDGVIQVNARRKGDRLCLTVSDNGRGAADARHIREGLGLSNIRLRLMHLHAANHRFQIETGDGCRGFAVSLEFPFRTAMPLSVETETEPVIHGDTSAGR